MNADILALLLKVSAILAVAAFIALVLHRASAAWRHYVWSAAMTSVIVLVVLQLIVPPIVVRVDEASPFRALAQRDNGIALMGAAHDGSLAPTWNGSRSATADVLAEKGARGADSTTQSFDFVNQMPASPIGEPGMRQSMSSPGGPIENGMSVGNFPVPPISSFGLTSDIFRDLLLFAWTIGSVFLLFRIARSHWHLSRLVRSSQPLTDRALREETELIGTRLNVTAQVRLLMHPGVNTPCTAGWRNPVVLLPANHVKWSEPRSRAVLMHELAHIMRRDSLAQTIASVVCALFWFHPACWIVARLLRSESERAADDVVISAGMSPVEYADHLLAIADRSTFLRNVPVAAVGMARTTQLETRLRAMLNARQSRRTLTRSAQRVAGIASLFALVPLAGLQARVQNSMVPPQPPASKKAPPVVQPPATVAIPAAPEAPAAVAPAVAPPASRLLAAAPARAKHASPPGVVMPSMATPLIAAPAKPARTKNEGPYVRVGSDSSTYAVPAIAPRKILPAGRRVDSVSAIVDTVIEAEFPTQPGDALVVTLMSGGRVTVHGWDQPAARMRARLTGEYSRQTRVAFGRTQFAISLITLTELDGAQLIVPPPDDNGRISGVRIRIRGQSGAQEASRPPVTLENEFELWVPRHTNIQFHSDGGDLTLHNLTGTFSGKTQSGTIRADSSRVEDTMTMLPVNARLPEPNPAKPMLTHILNAKVPPTFPAQAEKLQQPDKSGSRIRVRERKPFGTNGVVKPPASDTIIEQTMAVINGEVFTIHSDTRGDVQFHASATSEIRVRTFVPAGYAETGVTLDRMKSGPQLTIAGAFARKSDSLRIRYEIWMPTNMQLYVAPTSGLSTTTFDYYGVPGQKDIRIVGWMDMRCTVVAIAHIGADLRGTLTCGSPASPRSGFVPLNLTVNGEPQADRIRSSILGMNAYPPVIKKLSSAVPFLQLKADSAILAAGKDTLLVRYNKSGGQIYYNRPLRQR